jgi:hypothetical protein
MTSVVFISIILQRQPPLQIAADYARLGQGVEPKIHVTCKLRAGL